MLRHNAPPSKISALVRGLTYPGLRDGPVTLGRPAVRGVRDRVCFVAHRHKEDTAASMRQKQDDGGTASKVNRYEVGMVAETVRYLLLRGYKSDQVRRLRMCLSVVPSFFMFRVCAASQVSAFAHGS